MLRYLIIISSVAFCFAGCTHVETYVAQKLTAPLRLQLDNLPDSRQDYYLEVLIRCSVPITDSIKLKLHSLHVETESIIGDICTAQATADGIKAATNLDYIENIDLSQKRNLNGL